MFWNIPRPGWALTELTPHQRYYIFCTVLQHLASDSHHQQTLPTPWIMSICALRWAWQFPEPSGRLPLRHRVILEGSCKCEVSANITLAVSKVGKCLQGWAITETAGNHRTGRISLNSLLKVSVVKSLWHQLSQHVIIQPVSTVKPLI